MVTTTKTLYSTLNGQKFSDYGYLCFELLINGNTVRVSMTVVANRFYNQGYTVELFYVDSANVQRWVDIMYASDTSFYMIGSSNIIANNTRVHITGSKIETTIIYCNISDENIQMSHKKYIA